MFLVDLMVERLIKVIYTGSPRMSANVLGSGLEA